RYGGGITSMSIASPDDPGSPPLMVVAAARHAFREHTRTERGHAALVFDSSRDDFALDRSPRRLMFTGESFDLMLTVATTSPGKPLGGDLISGAKIAVGIRRPLRATIALHADEAGVFAESVIPAGTVCLVVEDATGKVYESNWLTI